MRIKKSLGEFIIFITATVFFASATVQAADNTTPLAISVGQTGNKLPDLVKDAVKGLGKDLEKAKLLKVTINLEDIVFLSKYNDLLKVGATPDQVVFARSRAAIGLEGEGFRKIFLVQESFGWKRLIDLARNTDGYRDAVLFLRTNLAHSALHLVQGQDMSTVQKELEGYALELDLLKFYQRQDMLTWNTQQVKWLEQIVNQLNMGASEFAYGGSH